MADQPEPTVRDRILAAIEAALAGTAEEIEIEPLGDPSAFPALGLFDNGDQLLEREAMLTRWSMSIMIEGFVAGATGKAPTRARNALDAAVVAAIMVDEQLGGLVELIEPGDRRNSTATLASTRRLAFTRDFDIQFTAQRNNPALGA